MPRAETASAATLGCLFGIYVAWALGLPALATALLVASGVGVALLAAGAARESHWPMLALAIVLLVIALGSPTTGWDARSIWLFHGKRIFFDGSLAAQLDGYAHWSQNDYPAFAPAVMGSVARLLGGWNELLPKAAIGWIAVPALALVSTHLETVQQRLAMGCLVVLCGGISLVNGYMDAVLAIYFVAGLCAALAWVDAGAVPPVPAWASGWARALATLAALAILGLLKNEGVVLFACLCAAIGAVLLRHRRWPPRRLVGLCALALLPLVLWKLQVLSRGIKGELASSDLLEFFLGRWDNVFFHLYILGTLTMRAAFVIPSILLLLSWRRPGGNLHSQCALVAAGLYFLVIYVVYLATPNDLRWHLQTSADRTVTPICLMLSYAALSRMGPAYWRSLRTRWSLGSAPA